MNSLTEYTTDVLIIGSGAAGLSLAIRLAGQCKIIILSKSSLCESSTLYAQGGIAAVFDKNDNINSHIEDTLISGAGICKQDVVEFVIKNARHCIEWVINQGVIFDTETSMLNSNYYHLTREAGHSHRRILHNSDATGKVLEITLLNKVIMNSSIQTMENRRVIDLVALNQVNKYNPKKIIGAYIWNCIKKQVELFHARVVVLATGGASKVYKYNTNPDISSGDGIAIAWRAGCRIANMEFNQFHPTCLFYPRERNFLLTEALRGEGAYLCRPDGSRFMLDFDNRAELAPRDIVARAINHEIRRIGTDCMYLDISHKSKTFIQQRFPNIYNKLLTLNIDMTRQPIPIVPAAHYTCGGIMVNMLGRTDLDGLYAIGEVSCTGLHGANRLASNSLLECLVFSWSAAKDILEYLSSTTKTLQIPPWNDNKIRNYDEEIILQNNWYEIQLLMWNYAGVLRTTKKLKKVMYELEILTNKIDKYYSNYRISNDLIEIRNLAQVATLIIKSALQRKESRGLHFILDYPFTLPDAKSTIL